MASSAEAGSGKLISGQPFAADSTECKPRHEEGTGTERYRDATVSAKLLDHPRNQFGELLASPGGVSEYLGNDSRLQVIGQAQVGHD